MRKTIPLAISSVDAVPDPRDIAEGLFLCARIMAAPRLPVALTDADDTSPIALPEDPPEQGSIPEPPGPDPEKPGPEGERRPWTWEPGGLGGFALPTQPDPSAPPIAQHPAPASAIPHPLGDDLALRRALRPLMRRVPSRVVRRLQEVETAEHYAETGRWVPSFRGQAERWLELALVVDRAPSMRIWHREVDAFVELCATHGAFRDVRRWEIARIGDGEKGLYKGSRQQARGHRELLHPQGRRLVLIISDFTSRAWDEGLYREWLEDWARQQPVALVHLLRPCYWDRGGLHQGTLGTVRATAPGQPNSLYRATWRQGAPSQQASPADERPIAFPTLSLQPRHVHRFARFLAGIGDDGCSAVSLPRGDVLARDAVDVTSLDSDQANDGEEALRRFFDFRRTASPQAQRLAHLLACFPLVRPLMEAGVQAVDPPGLRTEHLAEVINSCLVQSKRMLGEAFQTYPSAVVGPEDPLYDFRPGVRALLRQAWLPIDFYANRERVQGWIEQRYADQPEVRELCRGCFLDLCDAAEQRSRWASVQGDDAARTLAHLDLDVIKAYGGVPASRIVIEQWVTGVTYPPPRPTEPKPFADPIPGTPFDGPAMTWLPSGRGVADFALGQCVVRSGEYRAWRRQQPDHNGPSRQWDAPINRMQANVSWHDARAFCIWLSDQTGRQYRLPTDREWEYACMAGAGGRFGFDGDVAELSRYGVFGGQRAPEQTAGGRDPNRWQLHDMHGGLHEWTSADATDAQRNDNAHPSVHGGSWNSDGEDCTCASRRPEPPDIRTNEIGFRVARGGPLGSYPFRSKRAPALPPEPWAGLADSLADGARGPEMVWLSGGTLPSADTARAAAAGEEPDPDMDAQLARLAPVGAPAATIAPAPTAGQQVAPFSIGRFPVTLGEYARFCKDPKVNKELPTGYSPERAAYPASAVSQQDAFEYCNWLSEQTAGRAGNGCRYRLPTPTEWEYACRAGGAPQDGAGVGSLSADVAWYGRPVEGPAPAIAAGGRRPNDFGLHDMLGNVWELTHDEPAKTPVGQPSLPAEARGGAFDSDAADCRCTATKRVASGERHRNLGFRVVREGRWPLAAWAHAYPLSARSSAATAARHDAAPPLPAGDVPMPQLVCLEPGYFVMGDIRGTGDRWEQPTRRVRLSAFAIGAHPITIAQYLAFAAATDGHAPAWLEDGNPCHVAQGNDARYKRYGIAPEAGELPIVGISAEDAAAYCEWLSQRLGRTCRLPTEAQWEYACRAGNPGDWCCGDDARRLRAFAWYLDNSDRRPRPVGGREPNAWGLYDMHGNVAEWTRDGFAPYAVPPGAAAEVIDPLAPADGRDRVVRGGAFDKTERSLRSAARAGRQTGPAGRSPDLGFRIVCEP
jgi:formylglycine-generating enzyme required for sulfatase activity